jgi:hypothetical protein
MSCCCANVLDIIINDHIHYKVMHILLNLSQYRIENFLIISIYESHDNQDSNKFIYDFSHSYNNKLIYAISSKKFYFNRLKISNFIND